MINKTRVVLPIWCWNNASNKTQLKQNIIYYMSKSYPGYTVKEIHKYYAVCEVIK